MRQRSISYVDKLDARNPFDLNVLRISPEFLIDQNIFCHSFHKQYRQLSSSTYMN